MQAISNIHCAYALNSESKHYCGDGSVQEGTLMHRTMWDGLLCTWLHMGIILRS